MRFGLIITAAVVYLAVLGCVIFPAQSTGGTPNGSESRPFRALNTGAPPTGVPPKGAARPLPRNARAAGEHKPAPPTAPPAGGHPPLVRPSPPAQRHRARD